MLTCYSFYLRVLLLPACHSCFRTYVYRVPRLAIAYEVHSCVTREGFRLRVNLQKTRFHGCAYAIRAILNACTVLASIKFKSSCTVCAVLTLFKQLKVLDIANNSIDNFAKKNYLVILFLTANLL